MDKESLLEVIDFIRSTTDEELEKVKELQDKIDALSQLSLALMSNDWKKE